MLNKGWMALPSHRNGGFVGVGFGQRPAPAIADRVRTKPHKDSDPAAACCVSAADDRDQTALSSRLINKLSGLTLEQGVIVAMLPNKHSRFRHCEVKLSGEVGDLAGIFTRYSFSIVGVVFVLALGHGRFLLQRNSFRV